METATAPDISRNASDKSGTVTASKSHPKYSVMVTSAIGTLQERGGSSKLKILRFVVSQFDVGDEVRANTHVKLAIKSGLQTGTLVQVKGNGASGSFRLSDAGKKARLHESKSNQINDKSKTNLTVKETKPEAKKIPAKQKLEKEATNDKPAKRSSVKVLTKPGKADKSKKKEISKKLKKATKKNTELKTDVKSEEKQPKKRATGQQTSSKKKSDSKSIGTAKKTKSPKKTRVISKKTPVKAKKPKAATPKKATKQNVAKNTMKPNVVKKTTKQRKTPTKAKNATKSSTK